jgi:hypothetical protein
MQPLFGLPPKRRRISHAKCQCAMDTTPFDLVSPYAQRVS